MSVGGTQLGRGRTGGFTLVEMVTVVVVITMLTVLVTTSLADLTRTQSFQKGQIRLSDHADRIVRTIERDVGAAVRVFSQNDPDTLGYIEKLEMPVASIARGFQFPVRTRENYVRPDESGARQTGNLIFFGATAGTQQVDLVSGPRRIDLRRFVLYYESEAKGNLELSRWGSVILASRGSLDQFTDPTEQSQIVQALAATGVKYAWSLTEPPDAALSELTPGGAILPLLGKLPADDNYAVAGFLAQHNMQLSPNGAVKRAAVPVFAQAVPATGFPGGFEVKIAGPATGALMMIRLVTVGPDLGSVRNFAVVQRLIGCPGG